jgi:hypothetical protein
VSRSSAGSAAPIFLGLAHQHSASVAVWRREISVDASVRNSDIKEQGGLPAPRQMSIGALIVARSHRGNLARGLLQGIYRETIISQ